MDIIKNAIKMLDTADANAQYPLETHLIHIELEEWMKSLSEKKEYKDAKELALDILNNASKDTHPDGPSPYIELVKAEIVKL